VILDSFRLKGENALVTGSRAGLGEATAIGLAEAGANVVVHGSKEAGTDDVVAAVRSQGGKGAGITADLADPQAPERLIDFTVRELGSIDILVNNAGIIRRNSAADYTLEDWNHVLQIDLTTVFRLAQLAGRHMLAQGSGKIINIASLLSFQGGILWKPT
jgi:2-deoxy-D-gluconate 3-dehydrogenase